MFWKEKPISPLLEVQCSSPVCRDEEWPVEEELCFQHTMAFTFIIKTASFNLFSSSFSKCSAFLCLPGRLAYFISVRLSQGT